MYDTRFKIIYYISQMRTLSCNYINNYWLSQSNIPHIHSGYGGGDKVTHTMLSVIK